MRLGLRKVWEHGSKTVSYMIFSVHVYRRGGGRRREGGGREEEGGRGEGGGRERREGGRRKREEGGSLPHTLYFKPSSLNSGALHRSSSKGMDASNLSHPSNQAPNVLIDFLKIWIFSSSPAILLFKCRSKRVEW